MFHKAFFQLAWILPALLFDVEVALCQQDAWHMDVIPVLVREQIDPIISPNKQSAHMHRVIGGSNFAAAYNFDDLNASPCTTVELQADKSNYWMPQLFWITKPGDPSTTFMSMFTNNRFYYFLGRNDYYTPVEPFPKGLRMVTGNPNAKAPVTPPYTSFQCQKNATDIYYGPDWNFDSPCDTGVKTEVKFPSCWDGINLYKSDQSHMTFPSNPPNAGRCPQSHPVRLPMILLEVTWKIPPIGKGQVVKGHLTWANGDTTGYGIHADFVNGWDFDLLKKALNDTRCVTVGSSMPFTKCPVFDGLFDATKARACIPSKGILVEPTGNKDEVEIPKLPGCNPLWSSGPKPTCDPPVALLDASKLTGTDGPLVADREDQFNPALSPIGNAWARAGCYEDSQKFPTLAGVNPVYYDNTNLTVTQCTTLCGKSNKKTAAMMKRAGTSWVCQCADSVAPTALVSPDSCILTCPGNATQICGNIYNWVVHYTTLPTVGGAGCYRTPTDNSSASLIKAAVYTFTSSGMTRDVCVSGCAAKNTTWAGVYNGNTCHCGNEYPVGSGSYVPNEQCNRPCSGDSSQMCGGLTYLMVMPVAGDRGASSATRYPAGRQGCYAEGSGVKALQGNTFWHPSWMTPQFCQNGCSEMGYSLSGVENSNTCFCSDKFTGGQWLPNSECNKPCTGNSSLTCGGQTTIEVYNTSVATRDFEDAEKEHTADYIGCWVDNPAGSVMNAYTYSSATMTPAVCKQACAGFKYSLAGLENGQKCFCGNNMPTSSRTPSAFCNVKCAGKADENCGGGFNIDIYNASTVSVGTAPPGTPSGWKGCYSDAGTVKIMNDYSFSSSVMTNDMCRIGCASLNYTLAGNEMGNRCFCGNSLKTSQVLPSLSCNTPCPGNSTNQDCGGDYKMTLFDVADVEPSPTPPGWLACYVADLNSVKGLSGYKYTNPAMTSQACRAACKSQNFALSGTYNGDQCFCGNNWAGGGVLPEILCSTKCAGNSSEFCGSSVAMDVSTTSGYAADGVTGADAGFQGCFSDPTTMQQAYFVSSLNSPSLCAETCYLKGYTMSGVSQGNKCICGSTLPKNLVPASTCNVVCAGVDDKKCGSATAVAVYQTPPQVKYLESNNQLWNSTTGPLGYLGCYTEGWNGQLNLPNYTFYTSLMSTETCLKLAQAQGYKYAGTENGGSCYAANEVNWKNGGSYKRLDSDCNSKCLGSTQFCGGGGKMSLYDVSRSGITYSTPAGITGYIGCFAPGTMMSAPQYKVNNGAMTATACRSVCNTKALPWSALTGNNCFCSKDKIYGAVQPLEACSWKCAGNATEFCGAAGALSVYSSSGVKPASLVARTQGTGLDTALQPDDVSESDYSSRLMDAPGFMGHIRDAHVKRMGRISRRHG